MKYFATDTVSDGNNGEESSAQLDDQQAESPESELEKLKR